MTWLVPILYALSALATVLAWALAFRRAEHRPVAYLLTIGLATDAARHVLTVFVIRPIAVSFGNAPWTGWARAAGVLDESLFMAWPVAIIGASLVVFLKRRVWPAWVTYAALIAWVAIAHPMTLDGSLQRFFTAVQLVSSMIAIGCGLTWYRSDSKTQSTTAQLALALIAGVELVSIAFAWRVDIFTKWHLAQAVYLVLYATLIIIQGGIVWQNSRSQ
jgi:hypothetical protein